MSIWKRPQVGKRTIAGGMLVVAVGLVGRPTYPLSESAHYEAAVDEEAPESSEAFAERPPAYVAERGSYSLACSRDYYASVEFGVGAAVNHQGLCFSTEERHPVTGEWFPEHAFLSTAFVPYKRAGISGDAFFVVGKTGTDGDDVVELWTIQPAKGAYVAKRQLSFTSPIGTPLVTPPLTIQIVGGTYLPPSERPSPLITRSAVYQGRDLGGFRAVAADPDGRFLLALGEENPGLYRIATLGGQVELLLDSQTMPYLADASHINVLQDATLGRVYVIRAFGISNDVMAVLIFDTDNDGIMDYAETLDEAAYEQCPLLDTPTEDFLFY